MNLHIAFELHGAHDFFIMNDARIECVIDSLSMFGESSRASIMSQLGKAGVSFNTEEFQIEKFCITIREFLGQWSEFIFEKATHNICQRSTLDLEKLGLSARAKHLTNSELLVEVFHKLEAIRSERGIKS